MGQKVHVIDMLGSDLGASARALAAQMVSRPAGAAMHRDFFWEDWGEIMLTPGIAYLIGSRPTEATLSKLYSSNDPVYDIAVFLDTVKNMHPVSHSGWAAFLHLSERETRPSVMATALSYLRLFDTDMVKRVTDTTTIDLQALAQGEPTTIYIIVPPYRIRAYAPILRMWLTGMMHSMTIRKEPPSIPTLMLVDDAGQLGYMESLLTGMTPMRGYGMKLWTFWQSASQLEIYRDQAKTIIDNAGVVQIFGVRNYRAATEAAALIGGVSPDAILGMKADEQLLLVEGGNPTFAKQVRHYSDRMFDGDPAR